MACDLVELCVDANDTARLAQYWAGVLRRELSADGTALLPGDGTGFAIRFVPSAQPKVEPNQMHFDLTSTSLQDQHDTVARSLELGGRHHDVGQLPEEAHVVLADPEGNEYCVIPPGNKFLAETALIGALSSDGTQAVGYFWSEALGWPLVWDQDEETAIQSPQGGSKIEWGGPPVRPKTAKNRLHFHLGPRREVERLLSLGATRDDVSQCDDRYLALLDPDGNEFCVLTA